jgi:hypothetical protein
LQPKLSGTTEHFQRKVWWFIPVPHRFIRQFVSNGPLGRKRHTARFEMQLNSTPGMSYLWQHQVARRALFPGAAMFETAYAAAITCAGINEKGRECLFGKRVQS